MKTRLLISFLLAATAIANAQDTIVKPPFDGMDLTWINGQNRQKDFPLVLKDNKGATIVTGVLYADTYYNYNFANPVDNTQTISSTIGRHNEFTVNLASVGFETNYKNIIGRIWLQFGQMGSIVNDLDASVNRGRNTSINNLKYIREAAAGYHFDVWQGINVEMGIFMSYIGLESYVTQENWNYQRSMLCDFTPFYFSGARVQIFPSQNLKTELWLLNGWQSYNSYSDSPGWGSSTYYRPTENLQLVANFYMGKDTQQPEENGTPSKRKRFHHDNSIVSRYYNNPESSGISQAAFSLNTHYGFQRNDNDYDRVKASENFMAGASLANRVWFSRNKQAITVRADYMTNQSVVNGINVSPYLAFTPASPGNMPNNYDDAISAGKKLKLFQFTTTYDIMPNDHITFRFEYGYRNSNMPYFASGGGTTSANGLTTQTGGEVPWAANLLKDEHRMTIAVNFRL